MDKLPQSSVNGIIRSVKSVFVHEDISYLTKNAYRFILLGSGFIAHYNVYGFRDVYRNVGDLAERLLSHQRQNQWANFHPGERDYEYYMQKREIYNILCELASIYKEEKSLVR